MADNNWVTYKDPRGIFYGQNSWHPAQRKINPAVLYWASTRVPITVSPSSEATLLISTETPAINDEHTLSPSSEATLAIATEAPTLSLQVASTISPLSEATLAVATEAPTLVARYEVSPLSEATLLVSTEAPAITSGFIVSPADAGGLAVATEAPTLLLRYEVSPLSEATLAVATEAPTVTTSGTLVSPLSEATLLIATEAPTLSAIAERTVSPSAEATLTISTESPSWVSGFSKFWPVLITHTRRWVYPNEGYGKDIVYQRRYVFPLTPHSRVSVTAEATLLISTEAPTISTVSATTLNVTPQVGLLQVATAAPAVNRENPTNTVVPVKRRTYEVERIFTRLRRSIPVPPTFAATYDEAQFLLVPAFAGEYQIESWPSGGNTWADQTAPYVENVSGTFAITIDERDHVGVDNSATWELIRAGDHVIWYESAGRFIKLLINQVTKPSFNNYRFIGQMVEFAETDGTGDIDQTNGFDVQIRFVRDSSPVFARQEKIIDSSTVVARSLSRPTVIDIFDVGQRIITPITANLVVATEAPANVFGARAVSPAVAALTISGQSPNIIADGISPLAPEIIVMNASNRRRIERVRLADHNVSQEPHTRTVYIYAEGGASRRVQPSVVTLALATEAPIISIVGAISTVTPSTATLTVETEAPSIEIQGDIQPVTAGLSIVTEAPTLVLGSIRTISPQAAARLNLLTDTPGLGGLNTVVFPGTNGTDTVELQIVTGTPTVKVTRWTKESKPVDNWSDESSASSSWATEVRTTSNWT